MSTRLEMPGSRLSRLASWWDVPALGRSGVAGAGAAGIGAAANERKKKLLAADRRPGTSREPERGRFAIQGGGHRIDRVRSRRQPVLVGSCGRKSWEERMRVTKAACVSRSFGAKTLNTAAPRESR